MTERTEVSVETWWLSLSRAEEWTLHDVLSAQPVHTSDGEAENESERWDDPHRQAFETLDSGGRQFTRPQLEAMQVALARAHHTRRWEVERPRLETLLHRVAVALDRAGDDENRASDGEDRL